MNAMAFTAQHLLRSGGVARAVARLHSCRPLPLPDDDEDGGPTRAALMRDLLALGPASEGELARYARLASCALVPVLLKHDIVTGRVECSRGMYALAGVNTIGDCTARQGV